MIDEVIKGLAQVAAYLEDVIVFDSDPTAHVKTIRALFECLRKHNLKLPPSKARLGARDARFLGHFIPPAGICPNEEKKSALMKVPMPKHFKKVRALMGGVRYYRKFLPDLSKRIRPLTALLRKGVNYVFTPVMELVVRQILAELVAPPILVFPDWDAAADCSCPFHVYCEACIDGFGAALEQEQPDGSVRPIAYISRATLDSQRHWTPLDLEAGSIVSAIKRLRGYQWGTKFRIFSDHKTLGSIGKVGESFSDFSISPHEQQESSVHSVNPAVVGVSYWYVLTHIARPCREGKYQYNTGAREEASWWTNLNNGGRPR